LKGKSRRKRARSKEPGGKEHEFFAYSGVLCIGRIVKHGRSAVAFNAAELLIGGFDSLGEAFLAVSQAYLAECEETVGRRRRGRAA
jgi:hypothetical protein